MEQASCKLPPHRSAGKPDSLCGTPNRSAPTHRKNLAPMRQAAPNAATAARTHPRAHLPPMRRVAPSRQPVNAAQAPREQKSHKGLYIVAGRLLLLFSASRTGPPPRRPSAMRRGSPPGSACRYALRCAFRRRRPAPARMRAPRNVIKNHRYEARAPRAWRFASPRTQHSLRSGQATRGRRWRASCAARASPLSSLVAGQDSASCAARTRRRLKTSRRPRAALRPPSAGRGGAAPRQALPPCTWPGVRAEARAGGAAQNAAQKETAKALSGSCTPSHCVARL